MIYKKQSLVFIISFIIISFFWVAVHTPKAGGQVIHSCTDIACQLQQLSCEFDNFCCVGGTTDPCIECLWTGNDPFNPSNCTQTTSDPLCCVDPGPSGACCLSDNPSCEIVTEADCEGMGGVYQGDDTNCDRPACQPHFKCYKVTPKGRTPKREVNLVDQFEDVVDRIMEPNLICNPVDKNGEGITNPDPHLTCYKITPRAFDQRDITVNNQFGDGQELTVVRPEVLCLPSEKFENGDD